MFVYLFLAIITLLFIAVLLFFAVGIHISNLTSKPKIYSYEELETELKKNNFKLASYDDYNYEDVNITSKYGYNIYGRFIQNANSNKTVIIVHGFTANLIASARYIDLFYSKGYNVLTYDHRFHGQSGKAFCSMGFYEQHDLITCVDWVFDKVGANSTVGLHGESMGASTSIMAAGLDDRIAFVVADCGYSNFYSEAAYQLEFSKKIPEKPFMYFAELVNKIKYKFSYSQISPLNALKTAKAPILFIHGDKDIVTLFENSVEMHRVYNGEKHLLINENVAHAQSILKCNEIYYETVHNFLTNI